MKRKIVKLAAIALAIAGLLFAAAPAQAQSSTKLMDPVACTDWSGWFGTSWGQWRWCDTAGPSGTTWIRVEVDDILTDGYAVHMEACSDAYSPAYCTPIPHSGTHGLQDWDDHPVPQQCFESTGAPQNWAWPFLIVSADELTDHTDIRLVKGSCSGTHQNVASQYWHFTT